MQIDLFAERAKLLAELDEAAQRYFAARGAVAFIDRLLTQLQDQQARLTEEDAPADELKSLT